jgi:ParB family transcriptional regulator, chromosome partitioning protein
MSTENAVAVSAGMNSGAEKAAEKTPERPAEKRRALGRGLESLLPSGPRVVAGTAVANPNVAPISGGAATEGESRTGMSAPHGSSQGYPVGDIQAVAERSGGVKEIPLELIDENPYQTRKLFPDEALEELADSIKASGVVQPIVVRPGEDGRYVLVMGERRCRASKLAGKATIPAIVRRVSDQQAAEMTIIENLQRQDLNCLEQAGAFTRLSRDFGLTQEQIGDRVGLARETVSNYMRLLRLPGTVMQYLHDGELGYSEARLLLQFDDNEIISRVADEAVRLHLSVEGVEQLCIKAWVRDPDPSREPVMSRGRYVDPNVRAAQRQIEATLGMRVRIRDKRGKGKITIEYATLEDFDRLVGMLKGKG